MGCSVLPPPSPPRQGGGGGGGASPGKIEPMLPPPTPQKPHPAHRASSHAFGGLKSRGCGVEGGMCACVVDAIIEGSPCCSVMA